MSKEGYLIRHGAISSDILYCVVADGRVTFFDQRGGKIVHQFGLSRTQLKIRGVIAAEAYSCDFSFIVNVRSTQLVKGRQVPEGADETYLLSAPSHQERKEWGNVIHSWQRQYWKDPVHVELHMSPDEEDEFFRAQVSELTRMLQESPRGKLKQAIRSVNAKTSSLTFTLQQSAY
ncbi:hypothetical protein LEN26_020708 [Aphanomyces euteiches]|nr:hypothetical protein LEN26_020708 [Aphanomyces euteiches]KAH9129126.1 hypothetical protein AeMF1_000781 [Aphanomyces euteiches]KAH9189692.1 hypothetical protein AeNC1_008326 [Aphanomyces euteiches]